MAMNTGAMETMSYNAAQLNNLSASYLETGFQTRQHLSDYYVENASFLKMDNLTLGYNFGKIFNTCQYMQSECKRNDTERILHNKIQRSRSGSSKRNGQYVLSSSKNILFKHRS